MMWYILILTIFVAYGIFCRLFVKKNDLGTIIKSKKFRQFTELLHIYDEGRNNYVNFEDEDKIMMNRIKKNPVNLHKITKYIDNINDNEILKKFSIIRMSHDDICDKIYGLNTPYDVEKTFDTYEIGIDKCIQTLAFTRENNKKFRKIIMIIKQIKYDKNHKIINVIDSFSKCDIEKLKYSNNMVDSDKLIIFVYSGALAYYIFLMENNKHNIIEKICKHSYSYFYKYKDHTRDLTKVRCLNDYDPICKMVCRYYNYMLTNTILTNCDTNIMRSVEVCVNRTAFSRVASTVMYFKTRMIHFNDKIVMLDLSKAYDHVDRDILGRILNKFLVPSYITKYVNYIFSVKETKTNTVMTFGNQQGNPLSPALFNLYHYTIYKSIKQEIPEIDLKFFVDDITIYYKRDTPTEKIMNDLKIIENIYNCYGMSINKLKTRFINFSNHCMKQANGTMYLGVPISNNCNDIITIINNIYGKKLINLLNDAELNWLITHFGNSITIFFSGRNSSLHFVVKCIEASIRWRLQYFDVGINSFNKFGNKLKKKNNFLFKIFSENNNIQHNKKVLTPILYGGNVSVLDENN